MKVTVDTDQLLSAGIKWVKANVPAWPAFITAIAFFGWKWIWNITYTQEPYPSGFHVRAMMMTTISIIASFSAGVAWENYFRYHRSH